MKVYNLTDILVLAALLQGEKYGAEVVEFVNATGIVAISVTRVNQKLNLLKIQEVVESRLGPKPDHGGSRRYYYSLTTTGRSLLRLYRAQFPRVLTPPDLTEEEYELVRDNLHIGALYLSCGFEFPKTFLGCTEEQRKEIAYAANQLDIAFSTC